MRKHLNTLYVTLEGAYLHKQGQTVEVKLGSETKLRVPLHNLEGIVTFGWNTTVSAALMHGCAEAGVTLSFLSPTGRFLASSYGGVSGNVVLRKDQYLASETTQHTLDIARNLVLAKISNSRKTLDRAVRDHGEKDLEAGQELIRASDSLRHRIRLAQNAHDLDSLRGVEGESALIYFGCMQYLITSKDPTFTFCGRNRNPPLDPFNALLSFLYVILMHDCKSACEGVGLDPQCGFLHRDRPGRFSLALDLAEEFRAFLADRLAISMINRQQLEKTDFEYQESGAVLLKEESRKKLLQGWQERKNDEITHPFLKEKTTIGMLPHLQARLLMLY